MQVLVWLVAPVSAPPPPQPAAVRLVIVRMSPRRSSGGTGTGVDLAAQVTSESHKAQTLQTWRMPQAAACVLQCRAW